MLGAAGAVVGQSISGARPRRVRYMLGKSWRQVRTGARLCRVRYMVGAEYEHWRNVVVKLVESSLKQNALASTTVSILVGAKYELGEP